MILLTVLLCVMSSVSQLVGLDPKAAHGVPEKYALSRFIFILTHCPFYSYSKSTKMYRTTTMILSFIVVSDFCLRLLHHNYVTTRAHS